MQQCPLTLAPQNIGCGWDCKLLLRDTLCDWIQKNNLNMSQHLIKNTIEVTGASERHTVVANSFSS